MAPKKEVVNIGGGAATPLAEDFVSWLMGGLSGQGFGSGGGGISSEQRARADELDKLLADIESSPQSKHGFFGTPGPLYERLKTERAAIGPLDRFDQANPMAQTQGIAGVLNDILKGGAGALGGNLNELFQRETDRGVADLRERFTGTGIGIGTPEAVAESTFRADQANKGSLAIGQLQLQTLLPLLQIIAQISSQGIPQAQSILNMTPNPWLQGLTALAGAATGAGNLAGGFNA